MPTPDAFDSADYYDCDDSAETLTHGSPAEALEDHLQGFATFGANEPWRVIAERAGEVTVYASRRREVKDGDVRRLAERMAEWLDEAWRDEDGFGPPDYDDEPLVAKIAERLLPVVRDIVTGPNALLEVWACERCGERTYTPDEIVAEIGGDDGDA